MVSWNVAGVPLEEIGAFLKHTRDIHPWDFLCLQEAFRKTDGIATCSCKFACECPRPVIFTPQSLQGGLRCPAIVVNESWGSACRAVGCSTRWVAIDVRQKLLVVSAHLPHRRRPFSEFVELLEELTALFRQYPHRKILFAMDANCRMSGTCDWRVVGPGTPRMAELSATETEHASFLHEFLARHSLYLANTWCADGMDDETDAEQLYTRSSWDEVTQLAQIDFIAASHSLRLDSCRVEHGSAVSTDHFALAATFSCKRPPCRPLAPRPSLVGWRPASSWHPAVAEKAQHLDWQDWSSCADSLASLAVVHQQDEGKDNSREQDDQVLQELLEAAATMPPEGRRLFGKRIWRRRRLLRRQRAHAALEKACKAGRAPRTPSGSSHVNWSELTRGQDPRDLLFQHFFEIYGLEGAELEAAASARRVWIERWRDEEAATEPFVVTPALLRKALSRLKPGKASPDGITAEVLRELPDEMLR